MPSNWSCSIPILFGYHPYIYSLISWRRNFGLADLKPQFDEFFGGACGRRQFRYRVLLKVRIWNISLSFSSLSRLIIFDWKCKRLKLVRSIRGRSQTTLTSFCFYFDHLTLFIYTLYLIKMTFLTTYPLLLVNVVCKWPLNKIFPEVPQGLRENKKYTKITLHF